MRISKLYEVLYHLTCRVENVGDVRAISPYGEELCIRFDSVPAPDIKEYLISKGFVQASNSDTLFVYAP